MEGSQENRYARQMRFAPIGASGQEKIQNARVAVVGLGALGTVSAAQLVRAGVGFVRLVDRDVIETSNLQRQFLFDERDASQARAKAAVAAEKLNQANGDVTIEAKVTELNHHNAEELLSDVNLVVDGTDNLETRYLINEIAVKHQIPWSYGGAVSSYGTTALIRPGATPCLVCLFGSYQGQGHDTCDTVGVIAPVVSVIASLQVAEILKYLTGNLENLVDGLITVDLWRNQFQTVKFADPTESCPCCHGHHYPMLSSQTHAHTLSLCGRHTIQVRPAASEGFQLDKVAQRLSHFANFRQNQNLLQCDLGSVRVTLFADGRALFHGTDNPSVAEALYAQHIRG